MMAFININNSKGAKYQGLYRFPEVESLNVNETWLSKTPSYLIYIPVTSIELLGCVVYDTELI